MPAERRRELWNEPLPAAELATRLRELPLFATVTIAELYRIASAAKQVRHDPGTVLLTEGAIPETLHFLLDGRVIATGRESGPQAIQAPAPLGFTEALSGMPMTSTIRTDGLVVTLAMSRSELRTLLADNTDLVNGLFATLSSTPPGVSGTIQTTAAAADLGQLAAKGLTPVEKVLALQRVPLFARVSADEMRHLADAAKIVSMAVPTIPCSAMNISKKRSGATFSKRSLNVEFLTSASSATIRVSSVPTAASAVPHASRVATTSPSL